MPTAMEKVNIWYGANGTPIEERLYPIAASQTFKRGDLVKLSSGQVVDAIAPISNVGAGVILGIAACDAKDSVTGNPRTANTPIPVIVPNANFRWVLPVSTSSGAIGSSAVTAKTQVGSKYELSHMAAGKYAVDTGVSTNSYVVVTCLHPQYAEGEAYGWVEVQFLDAAVDVRV